MNCKELIFATDKHGYSQIFEKILLLISFKQIRVLSVIIRGKKSC